MFEQKIFVTEMSEEDFRRLNLKVHCDQRVTDDRGYSKIENVEKNMNDILDENKQFWLDNVVGHNNIVVVTLKDKDYIKYYTSGIQDYVDYPGCVGVYKKRNTYTFMFEGKGEQFSIPGKLINNIYLVHLS